MVSFIIFYKHKTRGIQFYKYIINYTNLCPNYWTFAKFQLYMPIFTINIKINLIRIASCFFFMSRYLFIDFAVGAYKSDEVIILRARPIVEVRVYSRIDPDPVPLTSTGTTCGSQGSTNPCFTTSLCFDFTGEGTNKTCMYYREIVFFWTKKWFIFNLTSFNSRKWNIGIIIFTSTLLNY